MHKMLEVKKKWREVVAAAVVSGILMRSDPRSKPPKGGSLPQQGRYFIRTDVSVFRSPLLHNPSALCRFSEAFLMF